MAIEKSEVIARAGVLFVRGRIRLVPLDLLDGCCKQFLTYAQTSPDVNPVIVVKRPRPMCDVFHLGFVPAGV